MRNFTIERNGSGEDGQEIVIRLESGTTIAVVQPGMRGFEPGQRVRVLTGPKGSRVEHARRNNADVTLEGIGA